MRTFRNETLAAQVDYGFEVEGLREEIGEGDGFDCVAGGEECAEIAGQRCGIAGDVDERWRGDVCEKRGGFWAQASAWRVDDYEVGTVRLVYMCAAGAAQEVEGGGVDGFCGCAV